MKVYSKVLKNNLKVIFSEDKNTSIVNLQLHVRMGSNFEKENQAGYSHFLEHLVFKNTDKDKINLMEKIAEIGGQINAYTEYDSTCFYISIASEFIEKAAFIIYQLVSQVNFNKVDFDTEKKVVIEELKQYNNNPTDFFMEEIPKYYFQKNAYKKPIIGTLENLKKAKVQDLKDFHAENYFPSNAFLLVSGNFDKENLLVYLEKTFFSWQDEGRKRREINNFLYQNDYPLEYKNYYFPKNINFGELAFVLPFYSEANKNYYAFSIGMQIFAEGSKSRLYKKLCLEEKLTSSINVEKLSGIYDGAYLISLTPHEKKNQNKICELFFGELENLINYGINEYELNLQKNAMLNSYKYLKENSEVYGLKLAGEELISSYEDYLNYENTISNISLEEINFHLKKNLKYPSIFYMGKEKFEYQFSPTSQNCQNIVADYYEENISPNFKIVFKKEENKASVGINLAIETNSFMEKEEEYGINKLTCINLIYGNKNHSYKHLLEYASQNGIMVSLDLEKDYFSVLLKSFPKNIITALNLLKDILFTPLFQDEYLDKTKTESINKLKQIKDNPFSLANQRYKEFLWGKESNLLYENGQINTLKKIKRKNILNWWENHLKISKKTLVIVGDFDFSFIKNICQNLFLEKENSITTYKSEINYQLPSEKTFFDKNKEMDQAIIYIGSLAPDYSSPLEESDSFNVLSQMLGGNFNAKMFEIIREKLGAAYSVGFYYSCMKNLAYYTAYGIVDKKLKNQAIEEICHLLERAKKDLFTIKDLQIAKNYIKTSNLLEQESPLSIAQNIAYYHMLGLGYQTYLQREQRLKNVNLDIILEIAKKYLDMYYTYVLN